MDARILTHTKQPLTQKQVEDFIIGCFKGLQKLNVMIYGFYYDKGAGIYTVGPREELEKLNNSNIEDFDFSNYIRTTKDKMFWLANYEDEPKINRMEK